jgi:hypothetical protein
MKKEMASRVIAGLLILLFAYAGLSKLLEHAMFVAQLTKFPWINPWSNLLSWVVPATELATVALLFFPSAALYGFYASACLLIFFTVFLLCMLSLDIKLPCSCGGVIALLGWKAHVVFNLFFLLLSIMGIYLKMRSGNFSRYK